MYILENGLCCYLQWQKNILSKQKEDSKWE